MLSGKKIVLGITGSIAAYKIPLLVRLLVREEAEVRVIMTPMAAGFVTPLTLSTLSKNPVIIEPYEPKTGAWNNHVDLGRWADAMIFAPVSANTLGKMAGGIADNFLVTAYLSAKCPVFIAPAMDLDMYLHPSTQANIEKLRGFGNIIIEPQVGELASGLSGPGRMEEPENILSLLTRHFTRFRELSGKKVLVTAGPTYEPIDPVRYIANHSTGRMGYSLAAEAAARGAEVTLVSGPSALEIPSQVKRISVVSAEEMNRETLEAGKSADIIIMAAAVADFTVKTPSSSKLKKRSGNLVLELKPTPDILAELGRRKTKKQILAGFALETDDAMQHAVAKLKEKNLDLIVLNSLENPGAGFGLETNRITIIMKTGAVHPYELKDKPAVAADIIDFIVTKFIRK